VLSPHADPVLDPASVRVDQSPEEQLGMALDGYPALPRLQFDRTVVLRPRTMLGKYTLPSALSRK